MPTRGPASDRRPEYTAAACVALLIALVTPLGLSSGEVADQMALAFGVRRPSLAVAPLADVLARFSALLPLGEAGFRAQGVAALAAVSAVGLLMAFTRLVAGPEVRLPLVVAIGMFGVSRSLIEAATRHPATAVDLALWVALMLALECIRRTPGRASVGLAVAFLCGLAAGVGWPVRAASWPTAIILTAWALRRGERWPLMAPTLFVAGAGVALAAVVCAPTDAAPTIGMLLHQLLIPASTGLRDVAQARVILAWVIDDVGVLGLLVAAVGLCLMVLRGLAQTWLVLCMWALSIFAALWTGDILAARLFIAAASSAPIVVAVAFFTASFGRARGAVAVVMVVIVVVPPAVVGIGGALRAPGRTRATLVSRRLDDTLAGRSPAEGPPTDPEAARWWRYARAVGLVADGPRTADGRGDPP